MGQIFDESLQHLCERGQTELIQTDYLRAARTLALAEKLAWESQNFDALSRLYLPLQEARRQIRQHSLEGGFHLHLTTGRPDEVVQQFPMGNLLVAGLGTTASAAEVRRLAFERWLYLEVFLGAIFPITGDDQVVVVAPLAETLLPTTETRTPGQLRELLPNECLMLQKNDLPMDCAVATPVTIAKAIALWERLHLPILAAAAAEADSVQRMQWYRTTLAVDPGCELAHQFLADIARSLSRGR